MDQKNAANSKSAEKKNFLGYTLSEVCAYPIENNCVHCRELKFVIQKYNFFYALDFGVQQQRLTFMDPTMYVLVDNHFFGQHGWKLWLVQKINAGSKKNVTNNNSPNFYNYKQISEN